MPNLSCMVDQKFSLWVEKFSRGKKKSNTKRKSLTGKEKVLQREKRSHGESKSLTEKEKVSQRQKKYHSERKRKYFTLKENSSQQNKETVKSNSD